jgi:hypothetical protein
MARLDGTDTGPPRPVFPGPIWMGEHLAKGCGHPESCISPSSAASKAKRYSERVKTMRISWMVFQK